MRYHGNKCNLAYAFVCILCLLCVPLRGEYMKDLPDSKGRTLSPFHEVFYLFYDDTDTLVKVLHKLAVKTGLRAEAFLNLGLVHQETGDFKLAKKFYTNALKHRDYRAVTYLMSINGVDREWLIRLLTTKVLPSERNPWFHYTLCLEYLKNGRRRQALRHLNTAVEQGLYGTALLEKEPLFDDIRTDPLFLAVKGRIKKQIRAAEEGNHADIELAELIDAKTGEYGKELLRAAELLKKTDLRNARSALEQLLQKPAGTRDRGVALYWLARIRAREGDRNGARKALSGFKSLVYMEEKDPTGFKDFMRRYYRDIVGCDRYLKHIEP